MKKIFSWILTCALLVTSFAGVVSAEEAAAAAKVTDNAYQAATAKLRALDLTMQEKDGMSLAEYVQALANFLRIGDLEETQVSQFAADRKLFAEAKDFGASVTYGAAVEAALNILGFEQRIAYAGGGEAGAISVANSERVNSGIFASANSPMGTRAVSVLFANLLDVKLMDTKFQGEMFTVTTGEETVLEKYFELEEKQVYILSTDRKNKTVTVEENGQMLTYNAASTFNFDNITIGKTRIYTDDDLNIYYIKVPSGSYVFYDYIYSVNGSESENDLFYPSYLEEMEFYNREKELDVAEGAIIYYNEKPVENMPYSFKDCYARIMVVENEIVEADIYSLYEGGLIYATDLTYIKYTQGEINNNSLQDLSKVPYITIVIDGVSGYGLRDLEPDMVFDFWLDKEEENMLIVASSRKAYGTLGGYSDEEVRIEKTKYMLSDNLYVYSTYLSRYEKAAKPTALNGEYVHAYIDDKCEIRYVAPDTSASSKKTIYGVVYRAYEDEVEPEKRYVKLIPISGEGAGNGLTTYPVKEKLSKDSLDFDYVMSVGSNLDGKGFLKFTLNGNGEISKIETVEHFGKTAAVVNNFDSTSYMYGGFYLKYATMIYIYESKDGFTVETGTYENLRDKYLMNMSSNDSITLTVDYDPLENPLPRFAVMTGDIDKIERGWYIYGFVNSITETEEDDMYKMSFGDTTYTVTKEFIENNNIKEGCFLKASLRYYAKEQLKIEQVIDLSGPIDGWKAILKEENGSFDPSKGQTLFYADKVLLRSTEYMQFMIDGKATDVIPVGTGYGFAVYEINDGRVRTVKSAPLTMSEAQWFQGKQALENITIGDRVWFVLSTSNSGYTHIGQVYYCRDSILPQER